MSLAHDSSKIQCGTCFGAPHLEMGIFLYWEPVVLPRSGSPTSWLCPRLMALPSETLFLYQKKSPIFAAQKFS